MLPHSKPQTRSVKRRIICFPPIVLPWFQRSQKHSWCLQFQSLQPLTFTNYPTSCHRMSTTPTIVPKRNAICNSNISIIMISINIIRTHLAPTPQVVPSWMVRSLFSITLQTTITHFKGVWHQRAWHRHLRVLGFKSMLQDKTLS